MQEQANIALESSPPNGIEPDFLWFKKVQNSMPFFVEKKPVLFEPLDKNFGVLKISALDPVAAALTFAANARRGGIVSIDSETYDALKKKLPFKPLEPKSPLPKLRIMPGPGLSKPKASAAAAKISDGASVGPVGGGGAGEGPGLALPAPAPDGEYKPETGKKHFKMPVTKKTTDRSFAGAVPDLSPD